MRDTKPVQAAARRPLTLDANIQDQAEQVLGEVGETWQPEGRDRDRHGPATAARSSRSPTGRGSTPTRPTTRPSTRAQNRAVGDHLRAGLDVQGVHRRRRARGRQGHAGHDVQHPADARRSPTARSRTPRRTATITLTDQRDPQGSPRTSAPSLIAQQARRRKPFDSLDPPLRLRQADRRRPPGRGARPSCCR